jgi:trk system potassium uptake protein TrkH
MPEASLRPKTAHQRWLTMARVLGFLVLLVGALMLPSAALSVLYRDGMLVPFLESVGITSLCGLLMMYLGRQAARGDIRRKDGYLIVFGGWSLASLFGCLPFWLSDQTGGLVNALFETASGFTTTGATILEDIERMPPSLLFWRSTTQWVGGMGIIVLTIAILPLLGIGGMELFASETPGPTKDKLHPRIRETAKRLWIVYVLLTLLCGGLLDLGGMTAFEAANHAMCTLSSGGFSTRNASIAAWDSPMIHYTTIVFMFLAGTNFTLLYLLYQGQWNRIRKNEEFRTYVLLTLGLVLLLMGVFALSNRPGLPSFRDTLFMVVSVLTTTGFVTADYQTWMPFSTLLFVLLLLSGASAGSTSGGLKIVRYNLLIKNTYLEMKRLLHPRAVIPVRFNGSSVPVSTVYNIQAFLSLYLLILIAGTGVLSAMGLKLDTAFGAVLAALGNVGPGLGEVGPMGNFAGLHDSAKTFLVFLMLLGRLELFTVLLVFTPAYWRN